MKDDQLKSAWRAMPGEKRPASIKKMLKENRHPALKRMRRQMLLEGIAYLLFLLVYFDFFDGHKKPLYANLLLVTAAALAFLNNIAGYALANLRITGDSVRELLGERIAKLKMFAKLSIGSRALLGTCLVIFFGSVITFKQTNAWIMAAIVLTFIIQLVILYRAWVARIGRLQQTHDHLAGE